MIRTAWPHDLPALRALFARANDAPYDLAAVAEEKCFGLGYMGQPHVRVYGDVQGAIVTCGRYVRLLIVDREARRQGIGSALLADAESTGAHVIAAEPGNYFTPGVPLDHAAARTFFPARGYLENRWTWNLGAELSSLAPPMGDVRRPKHEESDRVLAFIEREFGAIWRFEASKAFEREQPVAVISEENGEITGFAVHDVNNRGLGFFGPTGVAKSMRGRGIGGALLLASLHDMRRLGFDRAVIPWTDALAFYEKVCGATPTHRFVTFSKEL
ncbi:MAG TPA: GNAT family N-acetyltransferase [Thermoanaerobaculia bacterium]|nr:GNAT family N-acetyltransferase [Thermoanaerobaculia bacterium]